ncbi:hypothetical protein [Tsukamurella tyrosinosolvens]|uniref:hypothetical protein n=1 Tax=Tsukamurella tyrosinosolvens TaxID=57704 RepID=UPI0034620117
MSRPQEAHADLGLIDDDHTPEMRKASTVAPVDAEIRNPASKQEKIMTSTTHPTAPVSALVDRMAAIVTRCTGLGLTATVEKAGIRVLGLDGEEIVCSRDLDAVELEVENYWPDDILTRSVKLGSDHFRPAKVSAMRAYAGDPAAVFLDIAVQDAVTCEQAVALAHTLLEVAGAARTSAPQANAA